MRFALFITAWALAGIAGLRLLRKACEQILSREKTRELRGIAHYGLIVGDSIGTVIAAQLTGPLMLLLALLVSLALMRKKWRDD